MALDRRTPIARTTRMKPVNTARKKKLHERNYGDDAVWTRAQPCYVTGRTENIVAAHPIPKGRSGSDGLVPLHCEVEQDFHYLDEAKFDRKYAPYKKTKQYVRDAAPMYKRMRECERDGEPWEVEF